MPYLTTLGIDFVIQSGTDFLPLGLLNPTIPRYSNPQWCLYNPFVCPGIMHPHTKLTKTHRMHRNFSRAVQRHPSYTERMDTIANLHSPTNAQPLPESYRCPLVF